MTRGRRIRLATGLVALVSSGVLALAGASQAQDAGGSGRVEAFTLTSRAHAVRLTFDTPGALPIGPLLELTAPESRAGLATGDAGTAFSAVGHPGPVLAGLPQILATQGAAIPGLPPYPFAVEASTSGPTEVLDTTAVPGSSMRATAKDGHVEADTRTPALALPTLFDLGTLRSRATAVHDGGVAVSASTEVSNIDLLGGLVHVGAIRSRVEGASDGGKPTGTASTTVVDATLFGQPVTITADGIELVPGQSIQHQLVSSLLEPLGGPNGLLAATGLRIRAGATVRNLTDDTAVLGAEGLTIEVNGRIDTSALQAIVNQIPLPAIPGSPVQLTDLVGIVGSNQTRSLSIGQVSATLTARGPEALDDLDGDAGVDLGGGFPSLGGDGDVPSFDELGAPVATPGGTGRRPERSLPAPLPALPASGALAALGGGLVLSVGLRRFADVVLDPVAAGAACALQPDGGNDG